MSAAAFPNWVMLERFVFRRDDEESFPDDSKAPIRVSGTTTWDAHFRFAFCLAKPPLISRLYAQLPGFPDPKKQRPLAILATHRHLALFRVGIKTPARDIVQDFFIFSAKTSSLKRLPTCTEPEMDYTRRDGRLPRRPPAAPAKRRLLTVRSMGLLCRGDQEEGDQEEGEQEEKQKEFVVAELDLFRLSLSKVYADICLLRSHTSAVPGDQLGGEWNSMRVSILGNSNLDDTWQLCCWETHTVIPFDHRLCWIDYYRGILLCDVFKKPTPTVSFLRFPLVEFLSSFNYKKASSWLYRGASAVDDGRVLKFVNVTRHDGIGYGALKPGAGFTITCHTLMSGSMEWKEDYKVTSEDLWSANTPERLPRDILMFPQVNIDMPHVVHFLISDYEYVMKNYWVVAIDMRTWAVESFSQYINTTEGLETEDADLTNEKSNSPMSFLPCEFSKFLHFSRKRKDME